MSALQAEHSESASSRNVVARDVPVGVKTLSMSLIVLAAIAGCGGGGGGTTAGGANDLDPNQYSSAQGASLSTPNENVAVTHGSLALATGTIAYTATAGHLTATTAAGTPEASFFYAAYTQDGADPAARPVTFLFNGGPGSASAWLHLGSWAPRRIATGVPVIGNSVFPWVDNEESLLDTSDLVFVDAPGTGLSEAIAPNTNQTFWGVDADAAVFRDFVTRYLAANGRTSSPLYVYGESYGTVRAPLLALSLETAGVPVTGVVLQSSVLDYNASCAEAAVRVNCEGSLPSYAAVGDFFDLVSPPEDDLDAFLGEMRVYADTVYGPEVDAWIDEGAPPEAPPGADLTGLQDRTGLAAADWNAQFNMDYDTFRHGLVPGMTLGIYDGRMAALANSALGQGDPSNDYVQPAFQAEIAQMLPADLGYTNPSSYVLLGDAISHWNFSHDGLAFPDVVPDLAAVLALDPRLKVLQFGGDHDILTPFHQTERDLARLPSGSPVTYAFHPGGHMTYLDDTSRPLMKADLVAFYAAPAPGVAPELLPVPVPLSSSSSSASASAFVPVSQPRGPGLGAVAAPVPATSDIVATATPHRAAIVTYAASEPFRDPGTPPALRPSASPQARADALAAMRAAPHASGAALAAQVRAKLQARFDEADVGHRGALTAAEARAHGFGYIADHFDAIDTHHTGEVTFADLARYTSSVRP